MVNIEIDGQQLQAEPGSMIIEAADAANIYIPRFCYHKKLSIAANCRMCLVEVEKSGKPLPACATPVTDGMKVYTHSTKAVDAQKAVMEFLLINHPLDCPICDQGGECELQDLSMGYGRDHSLFNEKKRSVHDDDLGSLIASDMTRCIHCTRCVRFGQEIAGVRELGATHRGEHMEITTYVKHTLKSELSGNIIDLCPVGALTSKPFRFQARSWELSQKPSIAAHDCIGSNVEVHSLRGKVLRVVPRQNEKINEVWLSDRDRFSYTGIHTDRLTKPMIKKEGTWQECTWTIAFEHIVAGLQKIIQQEGPEQLAALASPSATLEELFLLQKVLRGLGSHNIDHRIHQTDFSDQGDFPLFPGINATLNDILEKDKILLIGSNVQREQPLAGHWLRQATLNNCEVFAVNVMDYDYYFTTSIKSIVNPQALPIFVAEIAKALVEKTGATLDENIAKELQGITASSNAKDIANKLLTGEKPLILLGALATNHPQSSAIRSLVNLIAQLTEAKVGTLTEGANTAGAWMSGAIPHRYPGGRSNTSSGLNFKEMIAQPRKAYLLFGIEPELDCANAGSVAKTLKQAEFVVSFSPFHTAFLAEISDVILPIVPFTETSGTYVNVEGKWQSFTAVTAPLEEARPGWKVLRVLGNMFTLPDFDYLNSESIRDEVKSMQPVNPADHQLNVTKNFSLHQPQQQLTRITEWPIYRVDALVRRSQALQQSVANETLAAYVNQKTIEKYQLQAGRKVCVRQSDHQVKLPFIVNQQVPDDCVWLPASYPETAGLGESFGALEIMSDHD